jgi:hypothetical protein
MFHRVMFDTFRRDVVSTGLEEWTLMDSKAASSIERCMRMCKFKMNKNIPVNTPVHVRLCNFQDPLWDMHYANGDVSVLSKIYCNVNKEQVAFANVIQSNIMAFALPLSIQQKQQDSLKRTFGACDFSMCAARYLEICTSCVVNGKVSVSTLLSSIPFFPNFHSVAKFLFFHRVSERR